MAALRPARRRLYLAAIAASALVAAIAAGLNSGIGPFPPNGEAGGLQIATTATHVIVDAPVSSRSVALRRDLAGSVETAVKHAELLGGVMVSRPVLDRVARRCKIPRDQISGLSRTTANVPLSLVEPDSERRASEILGSRSRYRLEVQSRPLQPLEGAPLVIAALTFLVVFLISLAVLVGMIRLRDRRLGAVAGERVKATSNGHHDPPGWLDRLRAQFATGGGQTTAADCWPRTRRVLPWTLAAFIALVWLVPFNTLELNASLPIDLSLDRLVLPVVAGAWALALIARATIAPRLQLPWIHAALGVFLIVALLSVALDAHYLNQTLELDLSLKKLPLLVSYIALFVITASAVRRREVPAFLTYTLALAVICALGMIYEYRFAENPFWDLSASLFPGFTLGGQADAGILDSIGRRVVRGPAEVPLEAVAMLTLALPIAVVRFMDTGRWRERIVYALATCLLMAAVLATYRKSAIVAPAAVVLTLVWFRRAALLRLAPLGMVIIVIVMALSPGALSSVSDQFTRSDAAALGTVSDRASDYDAIRPDVWTHLAFGRGWGSYNHETYRILDSEILHRTIETGVLGLLAFLLIPIAVLATTRRTIASDDPESASVGLVGAAIAVGFLVLALLFDVLSFPHVPYVFLYMTGLVAVVVAARSEQEGVRAAPPEVTPCAEPLRPSHRVAAEDTLVPLS